jgi:hypothetical protein
LVIQSDNIRGAVLSSDECVPCIMVDFAGQGASQAKSGARTYVEAVQPSDFLGTEITSTEIALPGDRMSVRHRLLDEVMEKGVIRRLRARGWLSDAPISPGLPAEMCRQFLAEKLPLTT